VEEKLAEIRHGPNSVRLFSNSGTNGRKERMSGCKIATEGYRRLPENRLHKLAQLAASLLVNP
jgi:hypothetical protein